MKTTFNGRFISPDEPRKGTPWLLAGIALFLACGIPFVVYGSLPASILCFVKYGKMRKEYKLYENFHAYCSVIGDRDGASVRDLAKAADRDRPDVRKDLQTMIARGWFGPGASFDPQRDCLSLPDGRAFEEKRKTWSTNSWAEAAAELLHTINSSLQGVKVEQAKADGTGTAGKHRVATDFKPEPAPERPKKPAATGAQKVYMDELERTLNELYELNTQIKDEAVSRRIDRIGELTGGIFRAVIENPSREQDVRKFMNYYLPTTLKLLKSYEMMESQSFQGENIVESRRKIENVMDMLIQAYEKQLDRLFHNDALDIATDIDVLETMMAGDGLSQKGRLQL